VARDRLRVAAMGTGQHHRPGDQRSGIAGPAGLHRQAGQIRSFGHHFLDRSFAQQTMPRAQRGLQHGPARPGVAHAINRGGCPQFSQKRSEIRDLFRQKTQAGGDAAARAEQIGHHRYVCSAAIGQDRLIKTKHLPPCPEHLHVDSGHLVVRRHGLGDPQHVALFLGPVEENAQARKDRQLAVDGVQGGSCG